MGCCIWLSPSLPLPTFQSCLGLLDSRNWALCSVYFYWCPILLPSSHPWSWATGGLKGWWAWERRWGHPCRSVCPVSIYRHEVFFFFLLIFFPFIFISWGLITLQYCSGFCHTLTWISHGFTCAPHPEPPFHLPPHPIPLGLPSALAPSTCLMHPTWIGCFTPDNIHVISPSLTLLYHHENILRFFLGLQVCNLLSFLAVETWGVS